MYINRSLEGALEQHFRGKVREGALVPGIVGCGKTTMITHLLEKIANEFTCFSFTGDETAFRSAVAESSNYILEFVRARTNKKSLVFVDEVQKEVAIFDAVKIAFDKGNISFIISGSNPEFIRTKATSRIQRRARLFEMQTLSMAEILRGENLVTKGVCEHYEALLQSMFLDRKAMPAIADLPELQITGGTSERATAYLVRGGLPLAWQAASTADALQEVKKVYERGFEPILKDTSQVSNIVAQALAATHSKEFSYQGIMQRSRLSQRRLIVEAINSLMAHGYLYQKQPTFFDTDHRSYLSTYSYCDPGIVSYLQGTLQVDSRDLGPRVEGVCHARLHSICSNLPVKSQLSYYKPFTTAGKTVRMLAGEVDFVVQIGKRVIPIEVKAGIQITGQDVPELCHLIDGRDLPFGIVFYGGIPKLDLHRRLVFLPWFLL